MLAADIEKMFRQILVHRDDQDYQRIIWRQSPGHELQEYRLTTVTYGTKSAPYHALRVLKQLVSDEGQNYPLACSVLNEQTYVDDCLLGAESREKAIEIRKQTVALLSRGGFHFRKWATNDSALLSDVDPNDCVKSMRDLRTDDGIKILGLSWHPETDTFRFNVEYSTPSKITKRSVLSAVARLFDPLGWLAPIIVASKIFFQKLWSLNGEWDDALPEDLCTEWKSFMQQLPLINIEIIPRWTGFCSKRDNLEIHGFADASTKAYVAVVYLRITKASGQCRVALITGKSKIAPVKPLTVPRLELCAAVLLARLIEYVRNELKLETVSVNCWSDSTVVLEWLRQTPSRWKIFVANRVAKIQELKGKVTWRYVPTEDNPADCASRGIKPAELQSHTLWWSVPPWLIKSPSSWPTTPLESLKTHVSEEIKSLDIHTMSVRETWSLQDRCSS